MKEIELTIKISCTEKQYREYFKDEVVDAIRSGKFDKDWSSGKGAEKVTSSVKVK